MECTEALYRYLNIDQKKVGFEEKQLRTQAFDFRESPKRVQEQMIKVKGIEKWLAGYQQVRQLADELELAFNFYRDEMITEGELDASYAKIVAVIEYLEMKNMPRQIGGLMGHVMEINSGAGSTEDQDWTQMLMHMYIGWTEARDYKRTISDIQDGDEAGIRNVTMGIEGGEHTYGYSESGNGVHRLVRVSPPNAQSKCMTSLASVFVSPLVDDTIGVFADPARVSWDTFRSNGAGEQNVSKVEFGVRFRHQCEGPDTGEGEEILTESVETHDQLKNRAKTMQLLKSQPYDRTMGEWLEVQTKIGAGKKKIEWGSQIRSYVFDNRCAEDHRINHQAADVDAVMDGKLDEFIKTYLMGFPITDESD